MTQVITVAHAGEEVELNLGRDGRATETVGEPCDNQHGGFWYCLTHQQAFQNQLQKDGHVHEGKHKLVWMCFEHGAETP